MKRRIVIRNGFLRMLDRANGVPLSNENLFELRDTMTPRPLDTELFSALRSLETDELIAGQRDETFDTTTWTLTVKGTHAAARLNAGN